MPKTVHLVAVIGGTPQVLTETLWWLVRVEGVRIGGVQVWTTTLGEAEIRKLLDKGAWELTDARCDGALGPRLEVELHVPSGPDGRPLEDVRDRERATAFARAVHERVRERVRELPADVRLVGSLAGGRKTMGAALQSALQLQGRPGDQLVHVLAHPEVERLGDAFVCPDPSLAVPLDQQVQGYHVPFVPMRALLEEPGVLDVPYDQLVWSPELVARVVGRVVSLVDDGRVIASVRLTPKSASLFLRLTDARGAPLTVHELARGEPGEDDGTVSDRARQRIVTLRRQLEPLLPLGHALLPQHERGRGWRIPTEIRVEVQERPDFLDL